MTPGIAAVLLGLALVAAPLAAEGQQAGRAARIGVLWPTSDSPTLEAFRQGLRDLGYVEGRNIANGSMSDPVAAGLVKSLAEPGGNLTGLTSRSPELSAKRLELVKELLPRLARVAVLGTAAKTATLALRETQLAARSLGMSLQAFQVSGPDDEVIQ